MATLLPSDPMTAGVIEFVNASNTLLIFGCIAFAIVIWEALIHCADDVRVAREWKAQSTPANLIYFTCRWSGVGAVICYMLACNLGAQDAGCQPVFRAFYVFSAMTFLAYGSMFSLRMLACNDMNRPLGVVAGCGVLAISAWILAGSLTNIKVSQNPFRFDNGAGLRSCLATVQNQNTQGLVYLLPALADTAILFATIWGVTRNKATSKVKAALIVENVSFYIVRGWIVVTLVNLIVGIMMFTDAAFVWKASFGCLAEALSSVLPCRIFLHLRSVANETLSSSPHVSPRKSLSTILRAQRGGKGASSGGEDPLIVTQLAYSPSGTSSTGGCGDHASTHTKTPPSSPSIERKKAPIASEAELRETDSVFQMSSFTSNA